MAVLDQNKTLGQVTELPDDPPAVPIQPVETDSVPLEVKVARRISLILHPFMVAPASIILILWLDQGNLPAAFGWAALCAAFVVLPGLLYLRRKLNHKAYTDADVSVREQRYGFYLFGLACMALCFATLIWLKAPTILIACFSAALLAVGLAALVNRLWTKVSIHAGMMAGVTMVAAFYSLPLALGLGIGTLLVSWARLVTRRHSLAQALLGWAIAVAAVLLIVVPFSG